MKTLLVSVIVACYSDERWADTCEAVDSVLTQNKSADQIILVVDNNPALATRARSAYPGIDVVENLTDRGAAGSRNAGAAVARHGLLAFLDDDALAAPDWLGGLVAALAPAVLGVGGPLKPMWRARIPSWFPEEFGWVVGASHVERAGQTQVRNVWAGNMLVRAQPFVEAGGFRVDFTKVGDRARPEDTEFCLRLKAANPSQDWFYSPSAVVYHKVPIERSTFRFFLKRCFNEGAGKVELASLLGWRLLTDEAHYGTTVLPRAILGHTAGALRGDTGQVRQLAAAIIGGGAAVVGASSVLLRSGRRMLIDGLRRRGTTGPAAHRDEVRGRASRRS